MLVDRPAARVTREDGAFAITPGAPGSFRRGHDPAEFAPVGAPERYDRLLATVPNDIFLALCGHLVDEAYAGRLRGIEYYGALCLLLELDRRLTPYYWTNIADAGLPFLGLIEHTNLIDAERYDGRRFLYVANYLPNDDELFALGLDALIERYAPGLRRVNPAFERSWIRHAWRFAEPAAQPIVTVGYQQRIPPLRTGVPGLVLANTTQVYPEDRGTNYAVRIGDDAARALLA